MYQIELERRQKALKEFLIEDILEMEEALNIEENIRWTKGKLNEFGISTLQSLWINLDMKISNR